jgi:hypothetical protein
VDKAVTFAGIFGVLAIVGIVLFVNSSISGAYVSFTEPYSRDFLVRPSAMEMHDDNGLITMRSDAPINQVCKNAPSCQGQASYTCCNDVGTECVLPSIADQSANSCPSVRRSRCLCREDYLGGIAEQYNIEVPANIAAPVPSYIPYPLPPDPYGQQAPGWRWSSGAGYY